MSIKLIILICTRVLFKKLNCFKKNTRVKNFELNEKSVMVIYKYSPLRVYQSG